MNLYILGINLLNISIKKKENTYIYHLYYTYKLYEQFLSI